MTTALQATIDQLAAAAREAAARDGADATRWRASASLATPDAVEAMASIIARAVREAPRNADSTPYAARAAIATLAAGLLSDGAIEAYDVAYWAAPPGRDHGQILDRPRLLAGLTAALRHVLGPSFEVPPGACVECKRRETTLNDIAQAIGHMHEPDGHAPWRDSDAGIVKRCREMAQAENDRADKAGEDFTLALKERERADREKARADTLAAQLADEKTHRANVDRAAAEAQQEHIRTREKNRILNERATKAEGALIQETKRADALAREVEALRATVANAPPFEVRERCATVPRAAVAEVGVVAPHVSRCTAVGQHGRCGRLVGHVGNCVGERMIGDRVPLEVPQPTPSPDLATDEEIDASDCPMTAAEVERREILANIDGRALAWLVRRVVALGRGAK